MHAARNGSEDIVELLLNADADVNVRDKDGLTAVSIARKYEHWDIAKIIWRARKKNR